MTNKSNLNRLDRKKLEEITMIFVSEILTLFAEHCDEPEDAGPDEYLQEQDKTIIGFIDQILTLIPEEGEVIAEGFIENVRYMIPDVVDCAIINKKGRLIFIEDKIINDNKENK